MGPDSLSVEAARESDLADVLGLMRHLISSDEPIDPQVASANWERLLHGDIAQILIGRLGGKAISSCVLAIIPNLTRGGRPYALIENVVTHADYRGRGFGKATMHAAIERARSAACYKVMLTTGRKDEAVFRFYENCGFNRDSKTAFEVRFSN
jgi:GNAT superfamily N-acetyltransferase